MLMLFGDFRGGGHIVFWEIKAIVELKAGVVCRPSFDTFKY